MLATEPGDARKHPTGVLLGGCTDQAILSALADPKIRPKLGEPLKTLFLPPPKTLISATSDVHPG
jgi:hypothetical protein